MVKITKMIKKDENKTVFKAKTVKVTNRPPNHLTDTPSDSQTLQLEIKEINLLTMIQIMNVKKMI